MPAIELAREIQIPGLPRSDILIMLGWYAGILVRIAVAHYLLTPAYRPVGRFKEL